MRPRYASLVAVIAVLLAGCGSSETPGTVTAGKVVAGETETGMTLKVESFVPPASDPALRKLDGYRAAAGYAPVDYHRVTAVAGAMPDRLRAVKFAANADDIMAGKGIASRFGCDVLRYEWVPAGTARRGAYNALTGSLCTVAPTNAEGIAPGTRVVYYLVTDRTFAERGLRAKRIFGPRDAELSPER
jgi:hypothetical protein